MEEKKYQNKTDERVHSQSFIYTSNITGKNCSFLEQLKRA